MIWSRGPTLWRNGCKDLKQQDQILNLKHIGLSKTVRTAETIQAVNASNGQSPQRSARRHAPSLGLLRRSLSRILHENLKLHPYKLQVIQVHALKDSDVDNRRTFHETFIPECRNVIPGRDAFRGRYFQNLSCVCLFCRWHTSIFFCPKLCNNKYIITVHYSIFKISHSRAPPCTIKILLNGYFDCTIF